MMRISNLHRATAERKPLARLHHNHTEVDVRYAWLARNSLVDARERFPRGSPRLICRKRLGELEAFYGKRYGAFLPHDDAGIDDLIIAAHHIAHLGPGGYAHIVAWAAQWMPDMPTAEAEALAKRVLAEPRRFKAATLGWRIGLTEAERTALGITTIRAAGVSDAEMTERRKSKRHECRDRWRQRQREKRSPKPEPLSRSRPWEVLGMSRATWYRKGKPLPEGGETTPGIQQVLTSPRCIPPAVSPSAARKVAVRRKITRPEPSLSLNTVSLVARKHGRFIHFCAVCGGDAPYGCGSFLRQGKFGHLVLPSASAGGGV
jgi:hypothetical protein